MIVYVLLINLPNFVIEYPYKFAFRGTCDKIGREVVSIKKEWRYTCVTRRITKFKD